MPSYFFAGKGTDFFRQTGFLDLEDDDAMNDLRSGRSFWLSLADSWWLVLAVAILTAGICFQRWYYTHRPRPETLKAGEQLSPLRLTRLGGGQETLDWKGARVPTLVYIFRPDCVWCARNLRAITALSEHAAGYRVVGVSTTSKDLRAYVAGNHILYPVYSPAEDEPGLKPLKVVGTPQTVIVDRYGRVEKVWFGAYMGTNATEIASIFQMKLPAIEK